MKFIDLCCGIGGFHYALKNMKYECVLASDIDENAQQNYELNHKIKPHGDLTNIDIKNIPPFDILCAGFPCQPFSKAGGQKGFEDSRGNIFFDICKIIEHHKPMYIILENVRNLGSHDDGNTWKVIHTELTKLDYNLYDQPLILNTLDFNVPQSRERVVILCKRKDLGDLPTKPNFEKNIKDTISLDSIIEKNAKKELPEKLKVTEKVWNEFIILCQKNNIKIPKFPIWTDWWDSEGNDTSVTKWDKSKSDEENKTIITKRQKDFYQKYKSWIDQNKNFYKSYYETLQPWLEKSRKEKLWIGAVRKFEWQTGDDTLNMNTILWSPRGSGVRCKKLNYSPTLVAMASMIPVYGPESRFLTPRECARLQSFPDSYKIHENDKIAYKQFGNAVNVKMIEKCARFLILNENLFN